jgi:ribosomal protein S8
MDLLSNVTSIIKNGYSYRKQVVRVPNSKLCQGCLFILYKLGYIQNFTIESKKNITVFLIHQVFVVYRAFQHQEGVLMRKQKD